MTIGKRIKKIRKEKKMTQPELAKKIGISVPTLQRYENGVTELKTSTVDKIAEALEIDIGILLSDDNEPTKKYNSSDLFVGAGGLDISYYSKTSTPTDETVNLKSVTIEHKGKKYSFTVTSDLSNEEIERAIKLIESYVAKNKK